MSQVHEESDAVRHVHPDMYKTCHDLLRSGCSDTNTCCLTNPKGLSSRNTQSLLELALHKLQTIQPTTHILYQQHLERLGSGQAVGAK